MNMNGIMVLLLLQVLHVLCSVEELRSLSDCGRSPFYPKPQIAGGYIIEPDEFSWMASLEYGSRGFGYCTGSVISSRYVLTAAHCVTGEQVKNYGGLTGLRLGNFTQEPYCDYGTSNCSSYLRFGISNITVHENYHKDSKHIIRNDIALLLLDRPIQFEPHIGRVCLPFNTPEPIVNKSLTVAGWGLTANSDSTAKRAVDVPLLDKSNCEHQDQSLMCAAKLADTDSESKKTCEGDSGGPLMHAVNQRQMVIEGIVSYGQSTCGNRFFPTHFTRVRHYLSWIEKNVCMGSDCASVAERKFPSDCGYTPMYPKEQSDGHHLIRPDEYSWLARLVYGNKLGCAGSVINSRYVLTTAYCVTGQHINRHGALSGVRLGDYDEQGHMCDYGIANCTHYQQFGIEKIIPHSGFRKNIFNNIFHNIALIRLDKSIQFGAKMKPICLPFGINGIPEPPVNSRLTLTGWENLEDNSHAKRDASVTLWETEKCKTVFTVDVTHICTANTCIDESGSPLMYYQSASQRMVLEGMLSYRAHNYCTNIRIPVVYTRVRSYRKWLDDNMEM